MPLNEKVIGKKYIDEDVFEITAHESIYYGLAAGEENNAYYDNRREGGIIAPPMFAVRYAANPVAKIVLDPEVGLNFTMVVHYTQEFEWVKPVKPGDKVKNEAEITHIDVRENGGVLGWKTITRNQNGEEVVISKWEFFDRSAGREGAGKPKRDAGEPGEMLYKQAIKIRDGQTFIYAEPSGDHNPIHVDNDFALKVGLQGIILQGLCTMAFAHKTVVENLCGQDKDPLKCKKLGVQFARPVLPGQTITYQGYKMGKEDGGAKYGIIAQNDQGKDVIRSAWCLII